jgi:SET domain-containing protein
MITPAHSLHLDEAGRLLRSKTIRRTTGSPVPGDRRKLNRGLSVLKSLLDGVGCFANIRFPKNSLIAEYAGERITRSEAMWRMRGAGGKRISELDADCYIDGSIGGNDTQYINHSCEPNADVLIIEEFMIVFALQEIVPGEEITVDYLNSFAEDQSVCHCRTPSCRRRTDQKAA